MATQKKFVMCGPCGGTGNPNANGIPVDEDGNELCDELIGNLVDSPRSVKSPRPCVFFARGACRNGDNCKFSHDGMGVVNPERVHMIPRRCFRGSECNSSVCEYLHPWSVGTRDALLTFDNMESASQAAHILSGMYYNNYRLVAHLAKNDDCSVRIRYLDCQVTDVEMEQDFFKLLQCHGIINFSHKLFTTVDTTISSDASLMSSVAPSVAPSPVPPISTSSTPMTTPLSTPIASRPMNYLASVKGNLDTDEENADSENDEEKDEKKDEKNEKPLDENDKNILSDEEYREQREKIVRQLQELDSKNMAHNQAKHMIASGEGIIYNQEYGTLCYVNMPILVHMRSGPPLSDKEILYNDIVDGLLNAQKGIFIKDPTLPN